MFSCNPEIATLGLPLGVLIMGAESLIACRQYPLSDRLIKASWDFSVRLVSTLAIRPGMYTEQ